MSIENKLTKNFTLYEFERSNTAKKRGIDNHVPNLAIYNNIRHFCEEQLQRLRDLIGKPVNISSGYRTEKLNKSVGGTLESQHQTGEAVDIWVAGMTNQDLIAFIIMNGFDYDQLIEEDYRTEDGHRDGWVHWSYKYKNRFEKKRIVK